MSDLTSKEELKAKSPLPSYTPVRVQQFLADVEYAVKKVSENIPVELWYHIVSIDVGTRHLQLTSYTKSLVVRYECYSLWEQVNILYGLRTLVLARHSKAFKSLTKRARKEERKSI